MAGPESGRDAKTTPAKRLETAAAELADLALPEGGTELDAQMSFEVKAVTHAVASKIAAEITHRVQEALAGPGSALVLFLDDRLGSALKLHRAFGQQVEVLEGSFESAREIAQAGAEALKRRREPAETEASEGGEVRPIESVSFATAAVAAGAVSSGVTAAVNLLGLAEGSTRLYGREVDVTQRALIMELAREMLGREGLRFRWPSLGVAPAGTASGKGASSLQRLHRLAAAADEASAAVHALAVAVQELSDDDPDLPAARLALDRAHSTYDGAAAILDELRESFFAGDEGDSPGHLLLLADDTKALLGPEGGRAGECCETEPRIYFLTANVEAAGGSYRIHRHLVQMATRKDPLTFSGGLVVSFALLSRDGDFVTAGTLRERATYRNFHDASTTFGQEREASR